MLCALLFAMFQNIAVKISFSLFFFISPCYALYLKTKRSKFQYLCISLFCYAMRYASKRSGQYFSFFPFFSNKDIGILPAMFWNIAHSIAKQTTIKRLYTLLFFYICYAICYISKHSGRNFIFFVLCSLICYAMRYVSNIAVKISFSLYFFILLCYVLCFKA